jgi:tetratricopeptide (TPR) repeat protein
MIKDDASDLLLNRSSFFRRIDWAAFWTATLISFAVFFFTLGPSVTLEDSGELAVAGDYLGVPHPPGYPIWTMCAFIFARAFEWVTFRGQPTPAWSIAMASAFFGALATGLTAMLITRSASDILKDSHQDLHAATGRREGWFCWAGGVSASLIFAFSPVMWSQATIVEVYTLNAFFLMLIFLLTYRWMRRPTDTVLWLTAFVFGLGLTNYQVLLLAAVPLAIVIILRDVAMFRDFLMVGLPVLLTAHVLKLGAMMPTPGFSKLEPFVGAKVVAPSGTLIIAGLAVVLTGFVAALVMRRREPATEQARNRRNVVLAALFGMGLLLLVVAGMVTHPLTVSGEFAPRLDPVRYLWIGILAVGVVTGSALAGFAKRDRWSDLWVSVPLALAIGLLLVLILTVANLPSPRVIPAELGKPVFSWTLPTLVFLGGCGLLFLLGASIPKGIFYALAVLGVQTALFGLVRKGALLGLTHPTTWWFQAPLWWNFGVLALAWLLLPHGRLVSLTLFFSQLGVSFYVYMPIVSDLRNPPMNWGFPRTWEGFKHAISRGQYEKIAPSAAQLLPQLGSYFTDLRVQFTLLLAPLGFLPFAAWQMRGPAWGRQRGWIVCLTALAGAALIWFISLQSWTPQVLHLSLLPGLKATALPLGNILRGVAVVGLILSIAGALAAGVKMLHAAIGLFVVSLPFVVLAGIPQIEQIFDITRFDKLLLAGVLLIAAVGGLVLMLTQLDERVTNILRSGNRSEKQTLGVLGGLTLLGLWFGLIRLLSGAARAAEAQSGVGPQTGAAGASLLVVLQSGLLVSLAVAVVVVLIWGRRALARKGGLRCAMGEVTQQWIIATVAAFLMMSVLLIVLANPKGDLQDAFIQKVKFVSSHGLFAIWIGYGLVFGLAAFDTLLSFVLAGNRTPDLAVTTLRPGRRFLSRLVLTAAVAVTLALAAIPVYRNYTDDRLVFEFGGSEQNAHDYGWQFGNYQLRGAAAITEELEATEEPLPNPLFPAAMGPDAVFFGGTDPGRFVPTYMIYSARVRPDVFLITQNALADNTYMATMRALYADQIWMPTTDDSAQSFRIYVDEVNAGKRPRNAELVVENGRVQVSGALGVMEINGILCEMIWRNNNFRHAFYVEESYPIPWMYPYFTPHGLIMKLNNEKAPLSADVVTADLDFWDWYWRRLTRDDRFRRDVVAQKSFSKLRGSIGGLYAAHGRTRESEQALQEARILYPPSPEANFKLAQDVLLRQGRTAEALDVIGSLVRLDPNNASANAFRNTIAHYDTMERRLRVLLTEAQQGRPMQLTNTLEIAQCYRDLGNVEQSARVLEHLAGQEGLPWKVMMDVGIQLAEGRKADAAERLLDRLMAQPLPKEFPLDGYIQIARAYDICGHTEKMIAPLTRYLHAQPNEWRVWITLAVAYQKMHKERESLDALRRAQKFGRAQAMQAAYQIPGLRPLVEKLAQQGRGAGALGLPDLPR